MVDSCGLLIRKSSAPILRFPWADIVYMPQADLSVSRNAFSQGMHFPVDQIATLPP